MKMAVKNKTDSHPSMGTAVFKKKKKKSNKSRNVKQNYQQIRHKANTPTFTVFFWGGGNQVA